MYDVKGRFKGFNLGINWYLDSWCQWGVVCWVLGNTKNEIYFTFMESWRKLREKNQYLWYYVKEIEKFFVLLLLLLYKKFFPYNILNLT